MEKLIITAHPSSKGFTHKIAESYIKGLKEKNLSYELLDLYKGERQNFFYFENVKELPVDDLRDLYQKKIKEAKEIIFIFPVWWGTCPAIMKNFFDNNFTSGFAYLGSEDGVKGLLEGKTARIFMTCDGPGILYNLPLSPTKITWKYFMLGFCGIKVRSFIVFGRMFKAGEVKRYKWLDMIYKISKE